MPRMADLVVPQLGESITEAVDREVAQAGRRRRRRRRAGRGARDRQDHGRSCRRRSPARSPSSASPVGATVKVGDVIGAVEAGKAGKAGREARGGRRSPRAAAAAARSRAPPPAAPPRPADAGVAAADGRRAASHAARRAATSGNGESLDKDAAAQAHAVAARAPRARPARCRRAAPAAPRRRRAARRSTTGSRTVDPRDEVVPMSPLRKRVAERLVQAQHESASLTTFNEVDMTRDHGAAREVQGQLREGARREARLHVVLREGVRRGAQAVPRRQRRGRRRQHRLQEALRLRHRGRRRRRASSCRCCATATQLSFAGDREGHRRARRAGAQTASSRLDDLQGGTFSITNGGIYGSMMSTPLLNYPQTGILGMHNIVKRADRRSATRSRSAR